MGTALAGVRHAEGVRHVQTGGADPQRGPAGDEQVRNTSFTINGLFFRSKRRLEHEVCMDVEPSTGL